MSLLLTLRPYIAGFQLVAYAALVYRLYSTRLYLVYRWFSIYIAYELARVLLFGFMNPKTNLYTNIYFLTQPITWAFYLLVIFELYHLVLKNHPGVESFGRRWILAAGSLTACTVSLATLFLDLQHPSQTYVRIATYVSIERIIVSSLLMFLFVLTVFLFYFPIPINRNTIVHVKIFVSYLTVKTGLLIFRNLITEDALIAAINLVVQLLAAACLVSWSLLLTQEGEQIVRASSHRRDPLVEARLLAQLDSINRTLLESAKK